MMRMLAIAQLNLVGLLRDRGELVSATVLPLLLTWVFSTAFGSAGGQRAIEIPVANQDGSAYSITLVDEIAASDAFDVNAVEPEEARRLVGDGDAPVAVIIEEGFGKSLEGGGQARVRVLRYPGSTNALAALTVVEGAARRVDTNARSATTAHRLLSDLPSEGDAVEAPPEITELYTLANGFWEPKPPVGVTSVAVRPAEVQGAGSSVPANAQYSIGFTVFFVFMVAMGSAGGVLEDRELGTLRRLLAAPLRRSEILGGKILGVAAVAGAQAGLLISVGALLFGVPWGQDPLAVALLALALVFSATGLGVMISALVRTRSQMSALVPIVSTALAMIGGCYWDLELTSPFMQQLARFTPTGWAMIGFKDVVARGAGIDAIALPLTVLAGFSVLTLAVGTIRLRLE